MNKKMDEAMIDALYADLHAIEEKYNVVAVAITEYDAVHALYNQIDQGDGFWNQCVGIIKSVWSDPFVHARIRDAYSSDRPLLKALFQHVAPELRGWGIGSDDTEFKLKDPQ